MASLCGMPYLSKAREKHCAQLLYNPLLNPGPLPQCQRDTLAPPTASCLLTGAPQITPVTQFLLLSMQNFSPTATTSQAAATTLSHFPFQPNPFGSAAGQSLAHCLTRNSTGERAGQHPLCQRNLEKPPQATEAGYGVGAEQDCRPALTCRGMLARAEAQAEHQALPHEY